MSLAFTLHMRTTNAAFVEDEAEEMRLVFNRIWGDIQHGKRSAAIFDSNGNSVGTWAFVGDSEDLVSTGKLRRNG